MVVILEKNNSTVLNWVRLGPIHGDKAAPIKYFLF